MNLPLGPEEIQKILPHRYPFLLVDRVIEYKPGEMIVGLKNVSANEWYFQGHFPDRPIMPGVLILEALAQLGAIYAAVVPNGKPEDKLIVFLGAESVRFKRPVYPGDVLRLELSQGVRKMGVWKMKAQAFVDGKLTVDAAIQAAEV